MFNNFQLGDRIIFESIKSGKKKFESMKSYIISTVSHLLLFSINLMEKKNDYINKGKNAYYEKIRGKFFFFFF